MPGKSKKGGGLEVKSAYKMKGWGGYQNSPVKKELPKGSKSESCLLYTSPSPRD